MHYVKRFLSGYKRAYINTLVVVGTINIIRLIVNSNKKTPTSN